MTDDHDAAIDVAEESNQYIVVRLPEFPAIVSRAIDNALRSGDSVDIVQVREWLVAAIGGQVAALFGHRDGFSAQEWADLANRPDFDDRALTAFLSAKGAVGVAVAHKLAAYLRDGIPPLLEDRLRAGDFRRGVGNGVGEGASETSPAGLAAGGEIPAECGGSQSTAGSTRGAGLPPYPRAVWATDRWWVSSASSAEISRDGFVRQWVQKAAAPKPRVKEFRDELLGWSGLVPAHSWVRARYGATAMILAKTSIALDSPDAWNALTLLYTEFLDSFARFSASFAALAQEYRPAPLPNVLINAVKCYEMQVPPHVRRAMSQPVSSGGTGGVVETPAAATLFCLDPYSRTGDYTPLALRKYATVLTEKLADADCWPDEVRESFQDSLIRLAPFGDPDTPLRPPTAGEERAADALLLRLIDSSSWVRAHPELAEGYLRARKTLLRWMTEGREVTDATILYTKLKSARLDEARRVARIAAHEHPLAPADLELFDTATDPGAADHADYRELLSRVRNNLADFPAQAPGGLADCWEKRWALRLLDSQPPAIWTNADIRREVVAYWRRTAPTARTRPVGAACANAEAAAGYVVAMLFRALASVATHADLPGGAGESALDAVARRHAEIERIIDVHRAAGGHEESGQ